jgi:hypothetical protein
MSLAVEDDLVSSVIGSVNRRGSSSQSAAGSRRWSSDEVEALSRWLDDDMATSEIAHRLGRSVSAVIAKADRHGLWIRPGRG